MQKFSFIQSEYIKLFPWQTMQRVGWGSIVGIVTGYGLDCLAIESQCAQDFLHMSRPALRPTQYNGYRTSFLG